MDAYSMVCICGAPPDQHTGKDHPFVEKRPDYDPATWPRELGGRLLEFSAPGPLYIQVEDRLRVLVLNSVAGMEVDVSARILEGNSHIVPMRNQNFPTSNRVLNTFDIDLTEGYLLDVAISTPTAGVKRGNCFVVVELIRGTGAIAFVDHCLLSDYVVTNHAIAWPGGRIQQSVESTGVIRSIQQGNPAAGTDFSFVVPTGARWQLQSLHSTLVTSATVASRFVQLRTNDGAGNVLFQSVSGSAAASQTNNIDATQSGGATSTNQFGWLIALPTPGFLAAGWSLTSVTSNLQVGDQWTNLSICVQEWLEP